MKLIFKFLVLIFISLPVFGQHYEIPMMDKNIPSILIEHIGYTVSFNYVRNNPNWVGWHLTKKSLCNEVNRIDKFSKDPSLPKQYRVSSSDYTYSGYDRGHMCPAADNKWCITAMRESFYMSNICPQNPILNRQWWEHLEVACRRWCSYGYDLFIICGPIYGKKSRVIGNTMYIDVPERFFKVIYDQQNSRMIAFQYFNNGSRQTMEHAVCTVDEIEKITGYDFFHELDDEIENKLESECQLSIWK